MSGHEHDGEGGAEKPLKRARSPERARETSRRTEDAELERRQREAAADWDRSPRARRDFSREYGQVEHRDWQQEIRRDEQARGRVEGRDFGIEHVMDHPDGGKVRYDYVDFRQHRIVDRKPAREGERVTEIARTHEHERGRHLEAYRHQFGVTPEYEYSLYPSTEGLNDADGSAAAAEEAEARRRLSENGD